MKHILIFLLTFYKKIISPLFDAAFGPGNGCRFEITCSQYSTAAISKYGVAKGGYMSIKRILHCHPFSGHNLKYESI